MVCSPSPGSFSFHSNFCQLAKHGGNMVWHHFKEIPFWGKFSSKEEIREQIEVYYEDV